MNRLRRSLSIFLVLAVVLSGMVFPAVAADTPVATTLQIYRDGEALTGGTDTVSVPKTGSTTYTYSAKVLDQNGEDYGATPIISIEPVGDADREVQIDGNGTQLVVKKDATSGSQYKVTAVCGSMRAEIIVTIQGVEIHWPTVTVKPCVYGVEWDEAIEVGNDGYAMENGQRVNGAFEPTNNSIRPFVNSGYTLRFRFTDEDDGRYPVMKMYDADISPRPITITAGSAAKGYDGTPLTEDTWTADGAAAVDEVSSVTVTGSCTDAGSSDNVPSNAVIVDTKYGFDVTRNYTITYANGKLTVSPKSIEDAVTEVTGLGSYEYTGEEIKPEPTVTVDGETLVEGKDYNVVYTSNVNCGEATAKIVGINNYTGTKEAKFLIVRKLPEQNKDYKVTLPSTCAYGDEPDVRVEALHDGLGEVTVRYNGKTDRPASAGEYEVTLDFAEGDNFSAATGVPCGTIKVEPRTIGIDYAHSTLAVADKTYNGRRDDVVLSGELAFTNVVAGDILTAGKDYTFVGKYSQTDAGDAPVMITVTMLNGNYILSNSSFGILAKILPVQTELGIRAGDAAYTGKPYDEAKISTSANVPDVPEYIYYADENGSKGALLSSVPTDAGAYWVEAHLDASDNYSAATSEAVQFHITKVPLTIKANDRIITYGDEPGDYSAEFTGLVNGETESVISSLHYACSYEQYGNAGVYTVTPQNAQSANYDITYESGKLTVEPKTVGLRWTGGGTQYYDGTAKHVTAEATGTVSDDVLAVTVTGGTQTEIGSYTATAAALTGAKAANYELPEDKTQAYEIVAALTDLAVAPETVTAEIDGLTIKLVGYKSDAEEIVLTAEGASVEGDTLTIHGVTYTIDRSGVTTVPAAVEIGNAEVSVAKSADADETVTDAILAAVGSAATRCEGMNAAAAERLAKTGDTMPEGAVKAEVKIVLHVQPKSFADDVLKLSIEPEIQYIYRDAANAQIGEIRTEKLRSGDLKAPVTLQVNLPDGFAPNIAKHYLAGGAERLPVTMTGTVASWQQSSFSDVDLMVDSRSTTITFRFADGSEQTIDYSAEDIGKAFPTDSKSGYTFSGWTIGGTTYKSLTDEALNALNGAAQTAEPSFTQNSGGGSGGSSGGGSGVTAYTITATAGLGGRISPAGRVSVQSGKDKTFTITPDDGYAVDQVLVDGKSVGAVTSYKFTNVKAAHTIEARFTESAEAPQTGFDDVHAGDYFCDAVDWAVKNGVTNGLSRTLFGPNETCTRAQTVTFLWRAAGSPAPQSAGNPFNDVASADYCYDAVLWATENGITNGISATSFAPNAVVTRGQVVTFLWRAASQPKASASSTFTDLADGAFYREAVLWAVEKGITNGKTGSTFAPDEGCTRGQIVSFLYRAAK